MNPFQSLHEYEEYVYTLAQRYAGIISSTLLIVRRGARIATLSAEIVFVNGLRLSVKERLTFDEGPLVIFEYGYEIWEGEDKTYWYDSQPHPGDASLAPTHPHHKHVPPDIKHHRLPAPGLSFTQPNLGLLIEEALIHR